MKSFAKCLASKIDAQFNTLVYGDLTSSVMPASMRQKHILWNSMFHVSCFMSGFVSLCASAFGVWFRWFRDGLFPMTWQYFLGKFPSWAGQVSVRDKYYPKKYKASQGVTIVNIISSSGEPRMHLWRQQCASICDGLLLNEMTYKQPIVQNWFAHRQKHSKSIEREDNIESTRANCVPMKMRTE